MLRVSHQPLPPAPAAALGELVPVDPLPPPFPPPHLQPLFLHSPANNKPDCLGELY